MYDIVRFGWFWPVPVYLLQQLGIVKIHVLHKLIFFNALFLVVSGILYIGLCITGVRTSAFPDTCLSLIHI